MPSNYSAVPLDEPPPTRSPRFSSANGLPLPVTANASAGAPSFPSTFSFNSHTAAPPSYPPPPSRRTLKGKGKAVDQSSPNHDEESGLEGTEQEGPAGMSFSIRFTDGSEDLLDFWCGSQESIGEVKRRLRFLRPTLNVDDRPRRLRLIQLGRLLTDGTYLVPYTVQLLSRRAKVLREETQPNREAFLEGLEAVGREIGVNVRDEKEEKEGKGKGKEKVVNGLEDTEAEEDKRVWLHCSVGEPMDDEEIEGEKEKIQTTQITPLQGLDRLRDAGFSEEDIASMRAEFRRNAGATIDGDDDEHARALEDQWMEGLTGQNEAAVDTSASERYFSTMLQGVCIGFFVPFLPFFFFRSQIFNRTMSMAIVLGAFINVGFGLLRIFS
ncbi:DUF2407 C-terminal domain-domain-containing protein [Leucosporidium creatinivorum]|uniref:DUF2407 C-terminal domain-domain-containing protein n=1 Tax=Leucosporidium creatinivorum TaxID=106004 RepID=A0A1Y2DJV1_9BASI|nr:DUF2407 C-terminal domain-domain-containing protein [Leucosporidium creatinivorum]